MAVTVVRKANWVVAWNARHERHQYIRNADVAFDQNGIKFVGPDYVGPCDKVIDGTDRMVMPGFVNIHSHPASEPLNKGLMEERASVKLGMSSLYEFMLLVEGDADTSRAASLYAVAEMLKSGVTTFVDYSPIRPNWFEDAATSGIRTIVAPMYRSGRWYTRNGYNVEYAWDEERGREDMAAALETVDRAFAHESGRLSGMVAPAQIDTCTEDLLQASLEEAKKRKIPVQLHAAQSVVEFREMVRRHGQTPIEWLETIGFLGRDTIVGHCIFVDEHSWINWPFCKDIERVSSSETSVAHCPVNFGRRGILLQNFGKYRSLGINIGIGTDTFPHNFIDEMRWTAVLCKVAAGNMEATTLADIYHAATVGGATALQRTDLGRLAADCMADLIIVDLCHPTMQPLRDPLKSLVFSALERPIVDVFVDGRHVVEDGKVVAFDLDPVVETLNLGQRRALDGVPQRDYAQRTADQAFPLTLEVAS